MDVPTLMLLGIITMVVLGAAVILTIGTYYLIIGFFRDDFRGYREDLAAFAFGIWCLIVLFAGAYVVGRISYAVLTLLDIIHVPS